MEKLPQLPARTVAALFLLSTALAAQDTSGLTTAVVHVRDMTNSPVSGAYVRLFPTPDRLIASTGDGTFSFAVKPGRYDLFVELSGFREVAQRVEVLADKPTVLNVMLQLGMCPPGPCVMIEPWDSSVMLSVSGDKSQARMLRSGDLKSLKREAVLIDDTASREKESYSGFSLADVLEKFCGPNNCDASSGETLNKYVVISGNSNFIAFPLVPLINWVASGDKIVIADKLAGTSLASNQVRAFLIKNGSVIESVRGIIGVRLTSPR